jgi:outer membrane translocation and assembly module TamA
MRVWFYVACALVLVASLAACHGPVHRPGEEYLDKLRFEGNHHISDKDLKEGLALERTEKRGGAPDPYTVQLDTDRVRGHYARKGYLGADVRSRIDRTGLAAIVVFTIDEGVRATTKFDLQGLPDGEPGKQLAKKIRGAIALEEGKPFDYDAYDLAKPALLGVVEDAGYAHAKLDAQVIVDRGNHQAVVTLVYVLGPICRFGEVKIEGVNGDLAESVDQRETFVPGDQYSTSAIAETQRALYAMNRFSTVRIQPDKSGNGDIIPVTISVSPGSRHQVTLGGGFGLDPLDYELRLRAGYTITGWPRPLYSAGVDLRPAYALLREDGQYEPRIRALASLQRMDLVNPFVTGEVDAGYNYLVVESYTTYGPVAKLGLTTPLISQRFKVRAGWRMQFDSFRDINPLIDATAQKNFGLDQSQRIGAYEQTVSLDLRDTPLETKAGAYFETRFTEGTALAGGALTFFEVVPEARAYVPIYSTVLAARVRVGSISGDVPVTERFYAGGAASNRGFGERQLAPTFSGIYNGNLISVPFGGTSLIDTSFEVRQLLGHIRNIGVGGVAFLDGGDVTETWSELDPKNLLWSAGVGLRALTIVGAIRADFGYRLNRTGAEDPAPGSHYAFHLSLGEAF